MDLNLVMEVLRPNENVSPDMSSYNVMVAHWRGSGVPPTFLECQTAWTDIVAEQDKVKYVPVDQDPVLTKNIPTDAMVEALWQFVVDANPVEKDKIQAIRDEVLKP